MAKKFEYKVTTKATLTNGKADVEAFDNGLDVLGLEGWELVGIHNHELIFKREMEPLPPKQTLQGVDVKETWIDETSKEPTAGDSKPNSESNQELAS